MTKRNEYRPDPNGMSDSEILRDLYARVVGDGTENNPGITTRLDRVESFVQMAKWVLGGILATAIGFVTNWFIGFFKGTK